MPVSGVTMNTITIRSSQKVFTEEEVAGLTGICLEHLRNMARLRKLGFLQRVADAAQSAGSEAAKWCYTNSDLMVLSMLHRRCEH
jgi:hypothetical protein